MAMFEIAILSVVALTIMAVCLYFIEKWRQTATVKMHYDSWYVYCNRCRIPSNLASDRRQAFYLATEHNLEFHDTDIFYLED